MTKTQKKRFLKTLGKIFLGVILIFVLAIIGVLIYINFKKDDLAKRALALANHEIAGHIDVKEVRILSLFELPNISIRLNEINVFEPDSIGDKPPVINIPELDLNANVNDIFNNRFHIRYVEIRGGSLIIERDSTGNTNISSAFYVKPRPDSLRTDSSTFYMRIDSILISDFSFRYKDQGIKRTAPISVDLLHGNLTYVNNEISGQVDLASNIDTLNISDSLRIPDVPFLLNGEYGIDLRGRLVTVQSKRSTISNIPFVLDLAYDYGETDNLALTFNSRGKGISIRENNYKQDSTAKKEPIQLHGNLTFETYTSWRSNPSNPFLENVQLELNLHGEELQITGIDIDKFIDNFKRSQNFNLLDVGAVLLAGPVGLAVTKGSDYMILALGSAGDSCQVTDFVSNWRLKGGRIETQDVAFSTESNLVAIGGWYSLPQEQLDFNIHLVDRHGCSLMTQRYYGEVENPDAGRVQIIKTFLGPVTNLFRDVSLSNCKTVYSGVVEHPTVTAKRKKKEAKQRKKEARKSRKQE